MMQVAGRGVTALVLALALALSLLLAPREAGAAVSALNPDDFVPPTFNAKALVRRQHESLAFRDTNVIVIPGDDYGDDWGAYWYGLAVVPLLIILVLPLWCVAVCCSPCCTCTHRKDARSRSFAFVAFSLCCLGATVAWCFTFALADSFSDAVSSALRSIEMVQGLVAGSEDVLESTIGALDNLSASVVLLEAACPPEYADAVVAAVAPVSGSVRDSMADLLAAIPGVLHTLGDIDGAIPSENITGGDIVTFGSVMLTLTLFFWIAVAVQYLNPGGRHCLGLQTCLARTSCVSIFTVGLFFISLATLSAASMNVLATVGSDVCAPNPDVTVQRLVAQVQGRAPLRVEVDVNSGDADGGLCKARSSGEDVQGPTDIVRLLCFYQTCAGDTVVSEALDMLATLAAQPLPVPPDAVSPACKQRAAEVAAFANASIVDAVTEALVDQFRCSRISPIYSSVLHGSICDDFVHASVSAWKYFLSGAFFLLVALALHRHFYLDQTRRHTFPKPSSVRYYQETTTNTHDAGDAGDTDALDYVPGVDTSFRPHDGFRDSQPVPIAGSMTRGQGQGQGQGQTPGKLADDGSFGVQLPVPVASGFPAHAHSFLRSTSGDGDGDGDSDGDSNHAVHATTSTLPHAPTVTVTPMPVPSAPAEIPSPKTPPTPVDRNSVRTTATSSTSSSVSLAIV